jgi:hypothetical protein
VFTLTWNTHLYSKYLYTHKGTVEITALFFLPVHITINPDGTYTFEHDDVENDRYIIFTPKTTTPPQSSGVVVLKSDGQAIWSIARHFKNI